MLISFREVRTRGARADWDEIEKEILKELKKSIRPALVKRFRAVIADWTPEHRPNFRTVIKVTRQAIELFIRVVGKNAKIWQFVSRGTSGPYQIPTTPPAKSVDGLLHYRVIYDARTQPRGKFSQGSGKKTGAWVTPAVVMHPGVTAREFEEVIAEQFTPEFRRNLENAMRRGITAAQRTGG
jgi:hypothetical protein